VKTIIPLGRILLQMPSGPLKIYQGLVQTQALFPDAVQLKAVTYLQRLFTDLQQAPQPSPPQPSPLAHPKGLYLHGGVGRGKTLLMDLFHSTLPPGLGLRAHSHSFFLSLHARMHAQAKGGEAAVASATAATLGDARVLCLDEIEISDIADAVLLRRVYSSLRASGLALVCTSNQPPEGLYRGGLNRNLLFLPFEKELRASAELVCLDEGQEGTPGRRDYRQGGAAAAAEEEGGRGGGSSSGEVLFLTPLTSHTSAAVDRLCGILDDSPLGPREVEVPSFSRSLHAPLANSTLARFSFAQLCGGNLSAADYLVLARTFPALVITGVPLPPARTPDMLRRLVTLVDVLYEEKTLVVLSAEGGLADILAEAAPDRTGGELAAALGLLPLAHTSDADVRGQGGSSGRSTLFVTADGVEWSATGRSGASLSNLGTGAHAFLAAAKARCHSRLTQMMGRQWAVEWAVRHGRSSTLFDY
jgi:cell division protein ZapE